jgi:hypothetical protein
METRKAPMFGRKAIFTYFLSVLVHNGQSFLPDPATDCADFSSRTPVIRAVQALCAGHDSADSAIFERRQKMNGK